MRPLASAIAALFTSVTLTFAQELPAKRSFSFEVAGVSRTVSVHWERILARHPGYFVCARLGFGLSLELSPEPSIPHGVTFNFGKKKSFFETGLLASLGPTSFGYADASSVMYFFAPMVGYRRHPARGFVFKIYFTTFIPVQKNPEVIPSAGISFGFTRKDKSPKTP